MNYDTKELSKRIQIEKRRGKYMKYGFYIGIILLFLYSLLYLAGVAEDATKVPSVFGIKVFSIVSESMSPTISVNDMIFVKECSEEDLHVGDIISFHEAENIITHRITSIEMEEKNGKKQYVTKGDNNEVEDKEKKTFEEIEGVYLFKIPLLR